MQLKVAALGLLALGLTACGQDASSTADGTAETAAQSEVADAGLFAEDGESDAAADASAKPPPVQCDPHAFCAGPLVVRADRLTLTNPDDEYLVMRGTLSFENRTAEDVRLVRLNTPIVVNLDNGGEVRLVSYNDVAGLNRCSDGEECLAQRPETFRLLRPGDSPAKVNIELNGRIDKSTAPTMGDVESGVLTMEVFTASADGTSRPLQVSLSDVPITNQLAK